MGSRSVGWDNWNHIESQVDTFQTLVMHLFVTFTRTQTMGKIVQFTYSDKHLEVLWVEIFQLRLIAWLYLLYANFDHGSTLNLYKQDPKLTEVPENLPTNIVGLVLAKNHIALLGPDSFPGLNAVKNIDLSSNRIAHIDDLAFQSCESLVNLNVEYNKITAMPSSFGPNSNNMRHLDVGYNPCIIQPLWFGQFQSLEWLAMDSTGMTELPNDLFNGLHNLNHIRLKDTGAPNLTGRTPELKVLWLSHFIGSDFPDENVRNLTKLTTIYVTGNGALETFPRFEGATFVTQMTLVLRVGALPDVSHMRSLTRFNYNPFSMVCDHRMCWTLFESYTFSLGFLDTTGCLEPSRFMGRPIREISKLELACYDSKTGIILVIVSANERRRMGSAIGRRCYFVSLSLIGCTQSLNNSCET